MAPGICAVIISAEIGPPLDALFAPPLAVRYCAKPENIARTPKLYLWSRSEGVMMHFASLRAVGCLFSC